MEKLSKERLAELYENKKFSSFEIAKIYKCSAGKINYQLHKFKIAKRSISESAYVKHNPFGDPFSIKKPITANDYFLYGLGLGLYWGEGNKKSTSSIRLVNTDPQLIKKFILFLRKIYGIDMKRLHFGLQVFNDNSPKKAAAFWRKQLKVKKEQFYKKIIVSKVRGEGTYKNKSQYGVLFVYFNNRKLRDILCGAIEKL